MPPGCVCTTLPATPEKVLAALMKVPENHEPSPNPERLGFRPPAALRLGGREILVDQEGFLVDSTAWTEEVARGHGSRTRVWR